jgi:hypothetical protein
MSRPRTEMHHSSGMTLFVERARLRQYFDSADGNANPWQWFAWRWVDDSDRAEKEWIAGPFDRKSEILDAVDRYVAEVIS